MVPKENVRNVVLLSGNPYDTVGQLTGTLLGQPLRRIFGLFVILKKPDKSSKCDSSKLTNSIPYLSRRRKSFLL